MPPRKAAKKAAKKLPGKHDRHKATKDARRTFEHLGRVQVIAGRAIAEQASIQVLVSTADAAYRSQRYKESAELLRAAEHLSFAAIIEDDSAPMSEVLVGAIQEEFDHLLERAEKNGAAAEAPALIRKIFDRMAKHASSAMRRRAYRAALEFARGAKALSHIEAADQEVLNQELLTAGVSPKKLRG